MWPLHSPHSPHPPPSHLFSSHPSHHQQHFLYCSLECQPTHRQSYIEWPTHASRKSWYSAAKIRTSRGEENISRKKGFFAHCSRLCLGVTARREIGVECGLRKSIIHRRHCDNAFSSAHVQRSIVEGEIGKKKEVEATTIVQFSNSHTHTHSHFIKIFIFQKRRRRMYVSSISINVSTCAAHISSLSLFGPYIYMRSPKVYPPRTRRSVYIVFISILSSSSYLRSYMYMFFEGESRGVLREKQKERRTTKGKSISSIHPYHASHTLKITIFFASYFLLPPTAYHTQ